MIQKQLTNLLKYVGKKKKKKKKKTTTDTKKKTFIPIITIQDVDINQNTKLFKYNKTQETENSKKKKKKKNLYSSGSQSCPYVSTFNNDMQQLNIRIAYIFHIEYYEIK